MSRTEPAAASSLEDARRALHEAMRSGATFEDLSALIHEVRQAAATPERRDLP